MLADKPISTYSAILELVGIKDLAENDPEKFLRATTIFVNVLQKVFLDAFDVLVHVNRDYCYIQCYYVDQLIEHLNNVRFCLLQDYDYFCRGAVVEGNLDPKSIAHPTAKNQIVYGTQFSSTASRLYGMQERIKGIGISVNLITKDNNFIGQKCLSTYYVNISNKKKSFTKILDIAPDANFMTEANLYRILKSLRKSNATSRRFASFYVPLLLLWAKSTSLTAQEGQGHLDHLICSGELSGLRRIPGIELVFLCFLNKVFSKSLASQTTEYDETRINDLKTFFVNSQWLQEIIATENNFAGIPEDVLTANAKQRFVEYLYD